MVSFSAFFPLYCLRATISREALLRRQTSVTGLDVAEKKRREYPWTPELDSLLEQGYRVGLAGQRAAIDRIQRRTGWPRQACWDRARKLGLAQKRPTSPRQWTPIEEECLIDLAGSKNVRLIAKRLNRSVPAVRKRLRRLTEKSARVRDGLTKRALAELIGRSPKTVQKWIELGWLRGSHEGKNRGDDAFRISDEQFLEFWRNHPEQVAVHRWNREGLEWLVGLLGETSNQHAIEPQREELSDGLSVSTAG
jgi:DNA-binding CsgD family transcriptional regulator